MPKPVRFSRIVFVSRSTGEITISRDRPSPQTCQHTYKYTKKRAWVLNLKCKVLYHLGRAYPDFTREVIWGIDPIKEEV